MFCRNCGAEAPTQAIFCPNCGVKLLIGLSFCPNCGAQTGLHADVCQGCGLRLAKLDTHRISTKSRLATTLLALFLGMFGAHRFYAGKSGTAIVMLILTLIGVFTLVFFAIGLILIISVGIWAFVDFILCVVGHFQDDRGLPIEKW